MSSLPRWAGVSSPGERLPIDELATSTRTRLNDAHRYREADNCYVAPFAGIENLRIAPFHLLASEGAVHSGKDHTWHMSQAHALAAADPAFFSLPSTARWTCAIQSRWRTRSRGGRR